MALWRAQRLALVGPRYSSVDPADECERPLRQSCLAARSGLVCVRRTLGIVGALSGDRELKGFVLVP